MVQVRVLSQHLAAAYGYGIEPQLRLPHPHANFSLGCGEQGGMEEHRKARRRFWEKGPTEVAAVPLSLSPPLQQENHRGHGEMLGRHPIATAGDAAVSHAKISAAAGVDGASADDDVRQGSSELSKLPFTVEEGEQCQCWSCWRCM